MKRFIAVLAVVLTLTLALAACAASDTDGNGGYDPQPVDTNATETPHQDTVTDETTPPEDNDPAPDNPAPEGFTFTTQGVTIHLDQNMAEVLEQLGEPLGFLEVPSCAFDGMDRIFSFPGVQIHTYPSGELDFIQIISIRDDSVTTMNGIYLGSSLDDVLAAYGDDYRQEFGMFTFIMGQTTLSFFIEDDMVIGITYELIMG